MRWLLGVSLLIQGAFAAADGMFVPPGTIEGQVTIPDQRAAIIWNEGKQTLIVESTLRGPAAEYSWILPLPAAPTSIEKVRASTLATSFNQVRPRFARANPKGERMVLIALVAVMPFLLLAPIFGDSRRGRLLAVAVAALCGLIAWTVTKPIWDPHEAAKSAAVDSAGDAGKPVDLIFRGDVGSYRVSVLRADDVDDLGRWLESAGTPLPDKSRDVAAAYVREGWCFMTAKLRKIEGVDLRAHPLKAEFPSAKPIYPMRLTGTMTNRLNLDLLVIGPRHARCSGLERWRSGLLAEHEGNEGIVLRHADLKPSLPPLGFVTRLRGKVGSTAMLKDFAVEWTDYEEEQPELTTSAKFDSDAIVYGGAIALLAAIVAAVAGAFFDWTPSQTAFRMLVASIGLGSAVFGGFHLLEPEADLEEPPRRGQRHPSMDAHIVSSCISLGFQGAVAPGELSFPERLVRKIATVRAKAAGHWQRAKPFTPTDIVVARSWQTDDIGGYAVEQTGPGRYLFRTLDSDGQVREVEVVDKPLPTTSSPKR